MRKILLSITILLLICGCSNNTTNTNNIFGTKNKDIETIDVWSIDPIFDFEDIDNYFGSGNVIYNIYPGATNSYNGFEPGGIRFTKNGLIGFMNGEGEIVTPPHYLESCGYIEECEWYFLHGPVCHYANGFLNKDYTVNDCLIGLGTTMFAIADWENNLAILYDPFCETNGIPFDAFEYYVDKEKIDGAGSLLMECETNFVLITKNDSRILDFKLDNEYVRSFNEIITTSRNESGNWAVSYYNLDGLKIAGPYEDGYGFYEDLAAVCKNGKWGYIDKQGNTVIDFVFDKATSLYLGEAWVKYNGRVGKLKIKEMLENNIQFSSEILNVEKYELYNDETVYIKVIADSLDVRAEPSMESSVINDINVEKDTITSAYEVKEDGQYTWYLIARESNGNTAGIYSDSGYTDFWIADKNGEWIEKIEE